MSDQLAHSGDENRIHRYAVSVVIPCRNEVKNIAGCVAAIYASKFDAKTDFEVIIVDGMSNDGTRELITTLQGSYTSLKLLDNVKQLTPFAFNIGVKAARGEYVQIIGARQEVSENYLQVAMNSLKADPEIWGVGGAMQNVYENQIGRYIAMAMDSPFGVGAGNFRVVKESTFLDTVGTPMYPAFVFDEVGYFDEALVRNQDDEFNYRITKRGKKLLLNADLLIRYYVRGSFPKLAKQYFQYGYWKVYVNKKVKAITTVRQVFPAILILCIAIGLILSPIHWGIYILWAMGVSIYLITAGVFAIVRAEKFNDVFAIFWSFMILHFSYGTGYLKGILDFLILGKQPSNKSKELSR